ncbi:MAG: recombination protein O N-terminal domain-containing protein [Bacteroidales bacterium]|nr:recombination protein O N-terminal domain-containing protein [Bacteroidales bacterium]
MEEKVRCLALRTIKYSDSTSIATVWTDRLGRLSVAVPAGAGREARRRRAIMMPLGVFDAIAITRHGRELATLADVRPLVQSPAASGDPVRASMAMFLSEFLYTVLKESVADPYLCMFLADSVKLMGECSRPALANFHLYFLYRLGHFLGIEPDVGTYHTGSYFDIKEARFTPTAPLHPLQLPPDEAAAVKLLSRIQPRSLALWRMSRSQRRRVLDGILQFYSVHCAQVSDLPSLALLREMFD